MKKKSIIYVNYSPYENSGKILDYLLENFSEVFLFSLRFHYLKKKRSYNNLFIYKKGRLEKKIQLFQFSTNRRFVFLILPIQSLITFFQILFYTRWLVKNRGKIQVYFTVNAFTAWIGNILKKLQFVEKTLFWVWDYYPPKHDFSIVQFMRSIYWQFDKVSIQSDRVVFINKRILELRKRIGVIPKNAKYPIVSIGTDKLSKNNKRDKTLTLGFIGVLKKSQGLSIVFENAEKIVRRFPGVKYKIIGSGPDEEYFRKIAHKSPIDSIFYGYLAGEKFNNVLSTCHIGIATYIPSEDNVSLYGDPGKVKRYLTLGIPVIITDVFEFATEIRKVKAGIVVNYYSSKELLSAIKEIMQHYTMYSSNAQKLSKRFYYKRIYKDLFGPLV